MRFLSIILIITFLSCNKNVQKNGRLKIVPTYCKYDNSNHFSKQKLKLFKKGKTATEIKLMDKNKIPGEDNFIVSGLEYGDYYIEYATIYNQKNVVKFEINQSSLKNVKICLDYLDYKSNKNILLIDELKNGESLLLDFFHQGCFDTFEKPVKLNLTKTNNKIVAEYNGVKYTLTPSQVDLFRQFEIELRSNHCGWCSSEDTYNLFNSKSYEIYGVKDSSGQWRGFNNLIKTLTGEK